MKKRKTKTAGACEDFINVTVSINNLNVRKGPGKKFASIGFLKAGKYKIVEIDKNGGYGKLENGYWICVNGIDGVELEDFISKTVNATNTEHALEEEAERNELTAQ